MMSNRSFFNAHLLRETMRRNVWAVALSFVGFFFCLPLPVAMTIQKAMSNTNADPQELVRIQEQAVDAVRRLLGMDNYYVTFGMIIMGVLCGIALFSYLHSRQRVDFYHALPVKRSTLFVNNYAAGLLTVLPAFVIMYALAALIAVAMGMPEAFSAGQGLMALAVHGLFFLLIYTVSLLAAILTGNTILAVLLDGWLMFSLAGVAAIVASMEQMFLKTWVGNNFLERMVNTSPIILYFETTSSNSRYYTAKNLAALLTPTLLGVLAATVVVAAFSFMLFNRRKSENAGVAVAFEWLKTPLKCYMVLVIALAFGTVMSGIGGEFWVWFGLIAGTVLGHVIVEMIYHIDVRAAFANAKTMIVLGVVAIAVVAGIKMDVLGHDTWLPREDQVQAVGFSTWGSREKFAPGGENGLWNMNSAELTDAASITAVRALAQAGVSGVKSGEAYREAYENPEQDWGQSYDDVHVYYQLKSGRTAARRYRIKRTDEIWATLDRIRFAEGYIREVSPLFDAVVDENMDSIVLYVRTQADPSERVGAELRAPAQTREIIETLREESLTLTREVATTTAPVLRIDMRYPVTDQSRYSYDQNIEYIPVYSTYTRTLALLEQYGGVTPRPLTVDDLKSITIYDNRGDAQEKYREDIYIHAGKPYATTEGARQSKPPAVITDRAEMEALLKNALIDPVARSCDAGMVLTGSENYSVHATYQNNQEVQLYYLADSFPEALCASYLG